MTSGPDLDALHAALRDLPAFAQVGRSDLQPMRVKGLAHDHVAIRGSGALLRVPKQSQFALTAADNFAYQAACFERVSVSRHAPRLHGVIAPAPMVPMGALVVDHIDGRPPRLPDDLPAFARPWHGSIRWSCRRPARGRRSPTTWIRRAARSRRSRVRRGSSTTRT